LSFWLLFREKQRVFDRSGLSPGPADVVSWPCDAKAPPAAPMKEPAAGARGCLKDPGGILVAKMSIFGLEPAEILRFWRR
jgi:hypothetical protein